MLIPATKITNDKRLQIADGQSFNVSIALHVPHLERKFGDGRVGFQAAGLFGLIAWNSWNAIVVG